MSANNSPFVPFIPPLPGSISPAVVGAGALSPPGVVPAPAAGPADPRGMHPAWYYAQNPANFPGPGHGYGGGGVPGGYPHVNPYPNMPMHQTPYQQAMQPPGSYFPPPSQLPPFGGPPPTGGVPGGPAGGVSAEWIGFGAATAAGGAGPSGQWPTGPPPPPGANTPWMGPQGYPQTPYAPPGTGFSGFGQPLPPMGRGMPPMMGGPPMMGHPGAGMYGMPPMPGAYPQTPAWGAGAMPPMQNGQGLPEWRGHGPPRKHDRDDQLPKFLEGRHYGPVLEPLMVSAVKATLHLNPLLKTAHQEDADQPYLKWNMLFPPGACSRSDQPTGRSWSAGRREPATVPRVTRLRLVCRLFPWTVEINARDTSLGVTCGDVIDGLHEFLYRHLNSSEFDGAQSGAKRKVSAAYWHNRSTAHGVPGGTLGEGLRRVDWLCENTAFEGLVRHDELVREMCGGLVACTFELRCGRAGMTAEEMELGNHALLQRSQRERGHERDGSVSTESSDSDSTL